MEIHKLLSELKKHKVVLRIEKGKLKMDVPKGASVGYLIDELKRRKEEIIEIVKNVQYEKQAVIKKCEQKEYYLLSSAQKRLYLLQQMDLESTVYNMPYIIPLEKDGDKAKIEEVFRKLIFRHESFRTSFEFIGEEPIQKIYENLDFNIQEFTIDKSEKQSTYTKFIQAFDLSKAPLLRVAMVEIIGESSFLMLDMHHIIFDEVSQELLIKEFSLLYNNESLSKQKLQYKDFAEWFCSQNSLSVLEREEKFWLDMYKDTIPILNLPIDNLRDKDVFSSGDKKSYFIDDQLAAKIKDLSVKKDCSINNLLFSIYFILLSKLSGQDDLIIGTVASGRKHADLINIIGFFVNMLAIRNKPAGNRKFSMFLNEVINNYYLAIENQNYQFDELIDKLKIIRTENRNPLVDAVYVFKDSSDVFIENKEILNEDKLNSNISHFDIMFYLTEYGNSIRISVEYSTKLFSEKTIDNMANSYIKLLEQIVENVDITIDELQIVDDFKSTSLDMESLNQIEFEL